MPLTLSFIVDLLTKLFIVGVFGSYILEAAFELLSCLNQATNIRGYID